jgi:cellulose synthase/poly-beta-1,6-N-acetylglucosamine synthase-like glycosyltransferase
MLQQTIFPIITTVFGLLVGFAYSYQIIYLLIPHWRKEKLPEVVPVRRYAVLISARNEENVLPYLLRSIYGQTYPRELVDVYVIADNCTDSTAQVARQSGAYVAERHDQAQVGKGYALNYLLDWMKEEGVRDRYDAFLVFDADNLLEPDYIAQLDKVCAQGYPAFCGYRNSKNYGDSWLSAGCGLMYLHESSHLNASRMALGTTCAVSGTGFGFTQELLEELGGWPFHTLTEDIEFNTWCASRGIAIGYCAQAVLYDEQTSTLAQSVRQRLRWARGGIQVSLRYGKELVKGFQKGGRTAWSCFEFATCSVWGYGMSAVSGIMGLFCAYLTSRGLGMALTLGNALVGMYGAFWLVAALTTLFQWKNIHCSKPKKIFYVFTYPIFMMTFLPIGVLSLLVKPQWKPIHHTVAIQQV